MFPSYDIRVETYAGLWHLVSLVTGEIIDSATGTYDDAYCFFDKKQSLNERINYEVDIVSDARVNDFRRSNQIAGA